jgi:hypothetical protein
MNKYQKVLLESNDKNSFYYCVSVKDGGGSPNVVFDYDNDIITLTQDEDIFSIKYTLILRENSNIETCTYLVNGEWQSAIRKGMAFSLELNFEKRVEKIKLTFTDNIVDEYIFSVQYIEADKDLYYQKQAESMRNTYIESAQIKHSTGNDLVNIYFQPCCSDYEYTEIYLYIPQDYVTVGRPYGPVKKPSSWQLFKKCKVPSEDFYKSINGLAYGTYAYVIKQFDKKDHLLLETEYIEFSLKTPKQPNHGKN